MKVYVVMDDRFPDPEAVFTKKKHAIEYANHVKGFEHHYQVYKYKVHDKVARAVMEIGGGERVVTDPSSY